MKRALIAIALFLAIDAHAAPSAEQWRKSLDESTALLNKGDFAGSLRISDRVIREMVDTLGPGDAASQFFAVAVMHKAVAHAGLGQSREALWYRGVARTLHPTAARGKLTQFGPGARTLEALAARQVRPKTKQDFSDADLRVLTAPSVVRRVDPQYPMSARAFGVSGILVLELIIDTDGVVREPTIVTALPSPSLSYAALEAVRQWKFKPGAINGTPVATIFNLTVNYKQ